MQRGTLVVFFLIVLMTVGATLVALPNSFPVRISAFGKTLLFHQVEKPPLRIAFSGRSWRLDPELKQGLDILGGMEVLLRANMSEIAQEDRLTALESAKEVIQRRVDLFGINEPVVQTSVSGDEYRIIVQLAGITDSDEALRLLGTTAQLDFRIIDVENQLQQLQEATHSGQVFEDQAQLTALSGKDLKRAQVQFDHTTNQPVISIEFNEQGREEFAKITQENVGKILGIYLDDLPITLPRIQTAIPTGQAQITGDFELEEAKQLAIQLNAGALPVPIEVIEQKTVGASLGQESVAASLRAGLIGIGLVMVFMISYYGFKGVIASMALMIYSVLTISVYKLAGVTLTLPGIAGLLLSVGMAVDANILIFERMKEELRLEKPFDRAMELGFGRAWDSIKDANLATIATALILINPLDFTFLNRSGLVKGFGLTLLIGVLISLFTGVVVTRTFMRLFLSGPTKEKK